MRYVEGTDLARLLSAEGRLDPPVAARIIAQIGAALDDAHKAGIVGVVMMQVKGASYLVRAPYTCYKNVKTPS